ncbi:MAG: BamA/TamA family outer membrane protein [Myxococcota bacterium]|nr:BamA/TamA family outer membrane protein [Myxococcota bacterium]
MGSGPVRLLLVLWALLLAVCPTAARAQALPEVPGLMDAPSVEALYGKNIERIEVVFDPPRWKTRVVIARVRAGQSFTPEAARLALDELAETGRYAELAAEAEPLREGVLLRLKVSARRVISAVRVTGLPADTEDLLRATGVRVGTEIGARDVPRIATRLEEELGRRGYPNANVLVRTFDADDPLAIVVSLEVVPGVPALLSEIRFKVWPDPSQPSLPPLLAGYDVGLGQRADSEAIDAANQELEAALRVAGFHDAHVEHASTRVPSGVRLEVKIYAGSRYDLQFEGNRSFDAYDLRAQLELDKEGDRAPQALADRIQKFYEDRGFLDAHVQPILRGEENAPVRALVLRIYEGTQVRVVAREYPCLGDQRDPREIGSEIDSFLSELPGGTLIDAPDPELVDALHGPHQVTGHRPRPLSLNPWSVYTDEAYERAVEHLHDLFRAEGYLSAEVGPAVTVRRACDPRSGPDRCIPRGERKSPPFQCRFDSVGVPAEEPELPPGPNCRADPSRGLRCEPELLVSLPIKLGPRAFIQHVAIDGARALDSQELFEAAELEIGAPVSQVEIDRARRRLLDAYAEEGFVFAEVDSELELSPDHRQATVRFRISERRQVRVSRIVVRGARMTSESLIRSRITFGPGSVYRRSQVRRTEEHLATLGVFASVSVNLEDPYVPASEKVVVVAVHELAPQHLDIQPGFSTGEGFRITFEYGHRNLGGQAIRLTLRSQLGLLPLALILEDDVRKKYGDLGIGERLERRNTATVELPDIGLGPEFRFSLEGVDVRDNARDFGLTKDAGIATFSFLPERRISLQLAGSLERNNALIFGDEQKGALDAYLAMNPEQRNAFRVPEGTTFVIAERIGATWDRRDNPLGATSGTVVSASVEHVSARPIEDEPTESAGESVFDATNSRFLRVQNRLAGYVRLSQKGLSLAMSFRWGLNQQLASGSRTYPDRLFFLGGVDSLRGFLQDSLVPEDLAEKLLDPESGLGIDQVVIRGGDVFVNPRVELRIPLTESVQTALFLDSGNLWADPDSIDVSKLRYAIGSGVRIGTPIGPLVFDYGFNVQRVLDKFDSSRQRQRYWESIGAFHFSIGLF